MANKSFHTYSFEKLDVWQLARKYRNEVYLVTKNFPRDEMFGMTSQMRRAANSICDNIAEGSGRASNIDKANFTNIAYSSALESINDLVGAYDLKYITEEKYTKLRIALDEIINKLNALYRYQLKEESNLKSKM